jgi:thiamine kinase-like enzyme
MLPDELKALAARHVPGAGPLDITRLRNGLVNETYKLLRGGAAFALRVASANPHHLGVDRQWEARLLQNAAAADLAPAPVYCDPQRGILISRWSEGRPWSPQDARQPANIRRMAELLRRVHDLPIPAPPRLMNAAGWIERYSGGARRAAGESGDAGGVLRDMAAAQLAALAVLPGAEAVVCHSDLHILNLIDRGGSLILLDWEYAHAADPLWDVAAWSANNDFEPQLQRQLLAAYTQRPPTPDETPRLRRLVWLYDYVCWLWSELYLSQRGDSGVAARAPLLAARLLASK